MITHQVGNSLSNYNYNTYFYTDKIWDYHFHKNFELIYVLKGGLKCTINNVEHSLKSGEFGMFLPYEIHRIEPENDTYYWILIFSEEYIHYFAKRFSGKKSNGFAFRCQSHINEYLEKQLIGNESISTASLKSCLYAICDEYFKNIKLVDSDKSATDTIQYIADYIYENHTKKISLSDIADALGYDYNYMSRYFRKVFNTSFTDFVNIYRLETAIKLLEDTDKNITDIVYESGFQSVRAFNNFFKKNTGVSPSEYRKAPKQKL